MNNLDELTKLQLIYVIKNQQEELRYILGKLDQFNDLFEKGVISSQQIEQYESQIAAIELEKESAARENEILKDNFNRVIAALDDTIGQKINLESSLMYQEAVNLTSNIIRLNRFNTDDVRKDMFNRLKYLSKTYPNDLRIIKNYVMALVDLCKYEDNNDYKMELVRTSHNYINNYEIMKYCTYGLVNICEYCNTESLLNYWVNVEIAKVYQLYSNDTEIAYCYAKGLSLLYHLQRRNNEEEASLTTLAQIRWLYIHFYDERIVQIYNTCNY